MNKPFTLSIEETAGNVRQYGFHLGTDERLARQIIEEKMQARAATSMALMRNGKIVDVLYSDGRWHNATS